MTDRDVQRIADAVAKRFDLDPPQGIVDAVYKKLDENALSDIRGQLKGMAGDITVIKDDIVGLKEDMAYVKVRVAGSEQITVMNENLQTLRDHLNI